MVIPSFEIRIDAPLHEPMGGKPLSPAQERSFDNYLQGTRREPVAAPEPTIQGCFNYEVEQSQTPGQAEFAGETALKKLAETTSKDDEPRQAHYAGDADSSADVKADQLASKEDGKAGSEGEGELPADGAEKEPGDAQPEAIAASLNGDNFVHSAAKQDHSEAAALIDSADEPNAESDAMESRKASEADAKDPATRQKPFENARTGDTRQQATDTDEAKEEPIRAQSVQSNERAVEELEAGDAASTQPKGDPSSASRAKTDNREAPLAKQRSSETTENEAALNQTIVVNSTEDLSVALASADQAESRAKAKLPQRQSAAVSANAAESNIHSPQSESHTQPTSAQFETLAVQVTPSAGELVIEEAALLESELLEVDASTANKQYVETPADPAQRSALGRWTDTTQTNASLPSPEASGADPARFVQRVARALQSHREGDGPIRLRLSPPELGSLRLEVSMKGGVLTARIEAETPATRHLLMDNLPALRDRLAEQNIKVGRLDVDLMDASGGGSQETSSGDSSARRDRPEVPIRAEPVVNRSPVQSVRPAASRGVIADGRLNVVV
ncbi:MAG: flagellar hook-length control protein FliK [Pirellulales bacterium]